MTPVALNKNIYTRHLKQKSTSNTDGKEVIKKKNHKLIQVFEGERSISKC